MRRTPLKHLIERIKDLMHTKITFRFIITFGLIAGIMGAGPILVSSAETSTSATTATASSASISSPKDQSTPTPAINIPFLSHPPKIDGKFDNPLWDTEALQITDFVQFTPKEKGEPSQRTVAWIGYDTKNLYLAIRAYDTEPDKLRYCVTTRDNCMEDDWVFLSLDTFNEKRRSYFLILNPLGIQMDMLRLEEGGNDNMDDSWDTMFFSNGRVDDEGFFVEMAIPFKSIRFPDAERKLWSVIVGRTIARTGEIISWPAMSKNVPGLLTQAQEMVVEGAVEKGSNFEIMP
ncbi:MAG: carbohydrate binding family 9 domain-containing protein, partial [Acidobacteria bacterium]|nr:carbohydrate binding family 9 domain-containing protein [Acidobacteriota bacterium]